VVAVSTDTVAERKLSEPYVAVVKECWSAVDARGIAVAGGVEIAPGMRTLERSRGL
jgi:hypothetical protein